MLFDASSLLNLHNGGLLARLRADLQIEIVFGPQVYAECRSLHEVLDRMIMEGLAQLADDTAIPASQFLALLDAYGLGEGETECLVLAMHLEQPICCDDRRARAMIAGEIGPDAVEGTISLMIRLVDTGMMSIDAAEQAHTQMVAAGGFLPQFSTISFASTQTKRAAAGN